MDLIEVSSTNTNRHPWELSRTECIFKEIRKLKKIEKVLDIGCGDCYFDNRLLNEFSEIKELYGVDIFLENSFSDGKGHWVNDLDKVPDEKFDLILMMDVLEHIEDDKGYMKIIKKYLTDDGVIIFTVPAFMKLYSLHDKELKHYRRYDLKMLKNTLADTGLVICDKSYFYFSLIILRLLTFNKTQNLSMWDSNENSVKTKFVKGVLNIDYNVLRFLSKIRLYIPGLSLFAEIKHNSKNGET